MKPFPKLMAYASDPDSLVVLFSDPQNGTVVFSEGEGLPPYGIHQEFDPADFIDVDPSVVVWLTEGPTDDIETAIGLVNQIRHSRGETETDYTRVQGNGQSDVGWGSS